MKPATEGLLDIKEDVYIEEKKTLEKYVSMFVWIACRSVCLLGFLKMLWTYFFKKA